jgi:hypothetical protein
MSKQINNLVIDTTPDNKFSSVWRVNKAPVWTGKQNESPLVHSKTYMKKGRGAFSTYTNVRELWKKQGTDFIEAIEALREENREFIKYFTPDTQVSYDREQELDFTSSIDPELEPEIELDFDEAAALNSEVKPCTYIDPKQSEINFKYYSRKVMDPTLTLGDFIKLKVMVYNAQQTEHGKYYFFPKGCSRMFWNLCRSKQEAFDKVKGERAAKIRAMFVTLIKTASSKEDLIKIRQDLYNNKVLRNNEKGDLFSAIRRAM